MRGHARLFTCMNEMCGMIAFAIISGANPIPPSAIRMADRRGGAAGERGPGPAACPHVRAGPVIEYDPEKWEAVFRRDIAQLEKARTAARLRRVLRHCADMGRMWRHEILSAVRFKKPATGSRRGLNSCDVVHMPVICPTCQILLARAKGSNSDSKSQRAISPPGLNALEK